MIVLTGAAGFIGSCLLAKLNNEGRYDVVLVDDFSSKAKAHNLQGKKYLLKVHRDQLFDWLRINGSSVSFVYHLGARTDTTEKQRTIFDQLNLTYSKKIWQCCSRHQIPLVYASSAATYGLGEHGFEDNHEVVTQLAPLNPYGVSKNDFDKWALRQSIAPPFWAGLKFFNVYGPNEYHKRRMASVIFHTFIQIRNSGAMKLFQSHRAEVANGAQSRDFIYVKDIVKVCLFLFENRLNSGLLNVGTGQARTFLDLVENTFRALEKTPQISYIPTPQDIRATYQYFTEANIKKLRNWGYTEPFYSLEEGRGVHAKSTQNKNRTC
ncbi:MAG: ADP-glyceromanno-heptose 6-epimerase [Bacteroidota bacterium]